MTSVCRENRETESRRAKPTAEVSISGKDYDLIKRSFDRIWATRRRFSATFFYRLFQIAPGTRALFANATEHQSIGLMDIISALVGSVEQPALRETLKREIAGRKGQYGVLGLHYRAFGEALIWTIEQQFKSDLSGEIRGAWAALYETLADADAN